MTNGLRGLFDKTLSIFFAKYNLGYKDVTETKISGALGYGELEAGPPKPAAKTPEEARRLAEEEWSEKAGEE